MTLGGTLVDTDVLIDFLRKKELARDLLVLAANGGDVHCSVITVAEIFSGMRPSEEKDTEELLSGLNILPVGDGIARHAGHLRKNAARNILLPDCLIAATALLEDCALLTFNRKDYPFKGIRFFERVV